MWQLEPDRYSHIISLLVISRYSDYTYLLHLFRIFKSNSILRQVSKMASYAPHHVCKALKELNVP